MSEYNILQARINNLKKLKEEIEQSYNPNPKYIESLAWAIKVCEKDKSRKASIADRENRW